MENLAIDLLSLYIGVEHYNECDDYGNLIESKEICMYAKTKEYKSDNAKRVFLVNLLTCDEIKIDQNGDVLDYISDERDIFSINHIHSLHDTIDELIVTTKDVVQDMENGKESLDYFITLKNHMDKMESQNNPAFLEIDSLPDIIQMAGNMYTLSYGNPLTNESKTRCLYEFRKGRGRNE